MATETELKLPVPSLEPYRRRLKEADAVCVHPSLREVNLLLDSDDRRLGREGRVLRVRTIGSRHLLTLKGPPRFRGRIKIREELELELPDSDTILSLLEVLGFRPLERYEKDRETWRLSEVTVTLDHTPMGDFIELEGAARRLGKTAATLGLDPARAVEGTYMSLWQDHRRRNPALELPEDMVFGS
jgi:adenylate cyclase class 2